MEVNKQMEWYPLLSVTVDIRQNTKLFEYMRKLI